MKVAACKFLTRRVCVTPSTRHPPSTSTATELAAVGQRSPKQTWWTLECARFTREVPSRGKGVIVVICARSGLITFQSHTLDHRHFALQRQRGGAQERAQRGVLSVSHSARARVAQGKTTRFAFHRLMCGACCMHQSSAQGWDLNTSVWCW